MAVSDSIAVIHKGKIEQIGTPSELYESPKSNFVAAFIGDTNFLDGRVDVKVAKEYSQLVIKDLPPVICFNDKKISGGELVHLIIRPEKIRISRDCPQYNQLHNCLQGIVEDVVYKGDHTQYWVRIGTYRIGVTQQHSRFLLDTTPITWKDVVWVWWHADDSYMLERYNVLDQKLNDNAIDTLQTKEEKTETVDLETPIGTRE
jgi:spermidine/putrescine transport system ATP-binding protein